jgi:hypothetical protein
LVEDQALSAGMSESNVRLVKAYAPSRVVGEYERALLASMRVGRPPGVG